MRPRWQWRQATPVPGQMMASPSLTEIHERLVRLGSEPVSQADGAWQELRRNLPDRPLSWSGRVMAWLRRPAIAIMTTGLLSTGVAHAAGVQPVRRGVDWLVGGVGSIVGAKTEAPPEREPGTGDDRRSSREGDRSWEENARQLPGGAPVDADPGTDSGRGGGHGFAPASGAGSGGDDQRDQGRDDRAGAERDGDELEDREDGVDEEESDERDVEERDDEELEEREEELEERQEERGEPEDARGSAADEREELEGDAYDGVDPEEDSD